MTGRSYTRWTLTIGEVPSSTSRSWAATVPVGQQLGHRVVGHRHHHRVGLDDLPVGLHLHAPAGAGAHSLHRDARADLVARGLQYPPGGVAVQGRQRHPGPSDVGRAGLGEQPGHEHLGRQLEGGVGCGGVDCRQHDQVPECLDGGCVLAVGGQPVTESHIVERGIVGIEPSQRQARPQHAQPLAEAQMRVGQQGRRQVQRGRSGRLLDGSDRTARCQHGDVEPALHPHAVGRADPFQERSVGGAAAHEDVLAVVEPDAVTLERPGGAAESGAALEQHDGCATIGCLDCGRQSGQAAADDHYPGAAGSKRQDSRWGRDRGAGAHGRSPHRLRDGAHGRSPHRLRDATRPFSQAGRLTRPSRGAVGWERIRPSSRR